MLSAFYIRVLGVKKEGYDESQKLAPVLKEVCNDLGIELKDASESSAIADITKELKEAIESADIVFADANSSNQNVWYEIGFADNVKVSKVVCLNRSERILTPLEKIPPSKKAKGTKHSRKTSMDASI